ncbi:MAG: DUF4062 domain-containing protein, partial [Streptosporangiaceae bacterium]
PYESLRFEDFVSQDRSSRDACLAGVDGCDVYILLLGPRYGEPLPDSGMAPTEEEFTAASRQASQCSCSPRAPASPTSPGRPSSSAGSSTTLTGGSASPSRTRRR